MKKNKILFITLTLAILILAVGCNTPKPQKPLNPNNNLDRDIPNNKDMNDNNMSSNRNIPNNKNTTKPNMNKKGINSNPDKKNKIMDENMVDDSKDMSSRADKIAKKITNLDEVNSSSVLLAGNTCIVGVDIKENIEGKTTSDLKQKIKDNVKNTDNKVKTVSVTSDPDIFKRISNMSKDVQNGNPISGFADEFEEILRRINPIQVQ